MSENPWKPEWERSTFLPAERDTTTGATRLAVPGAILGVGQAIADTTGMFKDAYTGKLQVMGPDGNVSPEAIGRATDAAGMLTLGAGAVPAEANSLNMGIRAYHGSKDNFDAFDISKAGKNDPGALGKAAYFSTDNAVSDGVVDRGKTYGGFPHKYEVELNLKNPIDIQAPDMRGVKTKIQEISKKLGIDPPKSNEEWPQWAEDVNRLAQEKGHDGVIYDYSPTGYDHKEIAVFDSSVINIVKKYGLAGAISAGLLTKEQAKAFQEQQFNQAVKTGSAT